MIKSMCLVLMSNLCCSNAGQVRKSLTIKAHADGTGYLISLSKYSFCSYLHFTLNSLNMLHFFPSSAFCMNYFYS